MTGLVIGLIVVGLLLMAIEILIIPGFGIFGILALASIVASAVVAYRYLGATEAAQAVLSGVAAAALLFWLLPRTRAAKSMVLDAKHTGSAADKTLSTLIGKEGRALTALHPAGTASIDNRTVDVVSDGQYVDPNSTIRVVRVQGMRVIVEPVAGSAPDGKK